MAIAGAVAAPLPTVTPYFAEDKDAAIAAMEDTIAAAISRSR